jgi:hypothetical protein
MRRTTIFLPDALERDLKLHARRAGVPVASVVREALAAYIVNRRGASRLPSYAGVGTSGRSDTAEQHEDLLWRNPGHAPRVPPRSRRSKRR